MLERLSARLLTIVLFTVSIHCSTDSLRQRELITCETSAECFGEDPPPGPPAPTGVLQGQVCDETAGSWVEDATVSVRGVPDATAQTNPNGFFRFVLEQGTYELDVSYGTTNEVINGEVTAGTVSTTGDTSCGITGPVGSISGRVCGGAGVWLSGAEVTTDVGGTTSTDGDGYFQLDDVAVGQRQVAITKGSFRLDLVVDVTEGVVTPLPDQRCLAPINRIAVVSGMFDNVETVLMSLGHHVRARYDTTTPTIIDPAGTIDIIKGDDGTVYQSFSDVAHVRAAEASFWVEEFFSDPLWMAEYDIIFLNCGVGERPISEGEPSLDVALENLRNYVASGKSVYASDWASEYIRMAFPDDIRWQGVSMAYNGSLNRYEDNRSGEEDSSVNVDVVDPGLAMALGKDELNIGFDLDAWAVMSSNQPDTTRILIDGNIRYFRNGSTSSSRLSNAAIVVSFDHGEGRVLFTSAHNEANASEDLLEMLRFLIFEL